MLEKIDDLLGEFKRQLCETLGDFESAGLSPRSLSAFERSLFEQLGELGRTIEQSVLEESDVDEPHLDIDGERHYRKYRGPKEYQCFLGKIEVKRTVYQANGARARTMCPLERNAGILHHGMTPLAAEFVSYSTALSVPAEVEEFCRRWHFLRPCATVIKHVASEVGELGEDLSEIYFEHAVSTEDEAESAKVAAVSRDGTMVNVRGEGWRQAEVGTIALYDKAGERLSTKYVAEMPDGSVEGLNEKLDREVRAVKGSLPRGAKLVFLADGALSNWTYQSGHPILKRATGILDFFHAAEKLREASEALFGPGSPEATTWFREQRAKLLEQKDGVKHVLRSLRNRRTRRGITSGKRAKTLHETERYYDRNREHMRYSTYLTKGLPIGSGVVEAACKTVVGHRLKRSGMRWSSRGGQQILNLRCAVLSRRWDSFWGAHEQILGEMKIAA